AAVPGAPADDPRAVVEQAGALRFAAIELQGEARGRPLPDIARGVVQAKAVGRELADSCRLVAQQARAGAAAAVGAGRLFVAVERLAPPVVTLAAAACRILPFGFGRQAITCASLARQPLGVGMGVAPGHMDDRALRGKAPAFV